MNQAYYHGQKLKWDPAKFVFVGGTGDPEVADPRLPQPVERVSRCQCLCSLIFHLIFALIFHRIPRGRWKIR